MTWEGWADFGPIIEPWPCAMLSGSEKKCLRTSRDESLEVSGMRIFGDAAEEMSAHENKNKKAIFSTVASDKRTQAVWVFGRLGSHRVHSGTVLLTVASASGIVKKRDHEM